MGRRRRRRHKEKYISRDDGVHRDGPVLDVKRTCLKCSAPVKVRNPKKDWYCGVHKRSPGATMVVDLPNIYYEYAGPNLRFGD